MPRKGKVTSKRGRNLIGQRSAGGATMPARESSQRTEPNFGARSFAVRMPSTVDDEKRSIEIVAATENPVPMPDWERWEMVDEVLLMSGAEIPADRQVVLLNSHHRHSVGDVLGSAREIKVKDRELLAVANFGDTSSAREAWNLVKAGHVRDLSVGYGVEAKTYVPEKTTQTIGGRIFTGPVNVVTKWTVREISVTPIGADEMAKMRGLDASDAARLLKPKEIPGMNPKLKQRCIAAGMPADYDDARALEWFDANEEKVFAKPDETRSTTTTTLAPQTVNGARAEQSPVIAGQVSPDLIQQAIRAERAEEKKRIVALDTFVRGQAEKFGLTPDETASILKRSDDESEAGKLILETLAERQKKAIGGTEGTGYFGPRVEYVGDGETRMADAIRSAAAVRFLQIAGVEEATANRVNPKEKLAKGHEDFGRYSIQDMARRMLEARGFETLGVDPMVFAGAAMGFESAIRQMPRRWGQRSDGDGHWTGMFPAIMLDAMNKVLLAGYTERDFSWRTVFRQGQSAKDFKNLNRIRIGDVQSPVIWPAGDEMQEASITDQKVTYCVDAYGQAIKFDWQMFVNDDLSALTVVPKQQGDAFNRLVNTLAWAPITSNVTMPYDSVALFSDVSGSRKQDNLSSGAISETTLGTARKLLRTMTGLNTRQGNASEAILNLQAAFVVVPAALETTARKYVESEYLADANQFQTKNQFRNLMVVVEPVLDLASEVNWYVLASPSQAFMVEVTFLQGQETPVSQLIRDEKTWGYQFQMAQSVAAAAIDHRPGIKFAN